MKPGSVVVDLAAEQGGNCEATVPNKMIETKNKVKIIGYTDLPSRMATQSSNLYSTNIRHMLDDLTPNKDGIPDINMDDDVIRGMTVVKNGKITYPPPKIEVSVVDICVIAPIIMILLTALVTDIKGVCSEAVTFQITIYPTKHDNTNTVK